MFCLQSADSVELAMKLNESLLKDREVRVERCKNKPKVKKNFAQRMNRPGKDKEEEKSGAYRRVKEKGKKEEAGEKKKSGGGWISKMKQRDKAKRKLSSGQNLQSFAGETADSGAKVTEILIKIIKMHLFFFPFI